MASLPRATDSMPHNAERSYEAQKCCTRLRYPKTPRAYDAPKCCLGSRLTRFWNRASFSNAVWVWNCVCVSEGGTVGFLTLARSPSPLLSLSLSLSRSLSLSARACVCVSVCVCLMNGTDRCWICEFHSPTENRTKSQSMWIYFPHIRAWMRFSGSDGIQRFRWVLKQFKCCNICIMHFAIINGDMHGIIYNSI